MSQSPQKLAVPAAETSSFERNAYFGSEFGVMSTPVISRGVLSSEPRKGPWVIEEFAGTTVVPPDAHVHRDEADNIVIALEY